VSNTFVGMPGFPEAAKVAVADTQLRRNLAHATSVIRAKRNLVVGELDDWQELRLAGAAIKDRVLRHLDRYLETFEAAATAAGAQVHWARDGDEAARLLPSWCDRPAPTRSSRSSRWPPRRWA
jgi:L-lactate dehydrogenase complex protein LldF